MNKIFIYSAVIGAMEDIMKKILSLVLVAVMLCAALVSCGGASYTLASGGTGGTYYAACVGLAGVYDTETSLKINVDSTGASKANIQLVSNGQADFAIVQNDVMEYAYTGTDLFSDGEPIKNFRTVAAVYAEVCQIVASTEIESVADLKGKVVSIGAAGSGVEFNALQILEAYGLTRDDIIPINADFNGSATKFKDGEIDAFFVVAGAPTTAITDLSVNREFKLLAIDDEHYDVLASKYGFYSKYPITAGTYTNTEDVQTVAVKATFICREDIPEDVVYEFTKTLFEKKDALTVAHNKFANVDLSYAQDDIGSVPFHAGALRYYNEVK